MLLRVLLRMLRMLLCMLRVLLRMLRMLLCMLRVLLRMLRVLLRMLCMLRVLLCVLLWMSRMLSAGGSANNSTCALRTSSRLRLPHGMPSRGTSDHVRTSHRTRTRSMVA